jgi:MoaA/NifB/PqqE/SkfB family radical SAM enzyme
MWSTLPKRSVNFAVTYRCNSRCITCNIWKKYREDSGQRVQELTLDEIKKIFNEAHHLKNLKSINLTGGEAFLREDFTELCSFFIRKYPEAGIFTNTNALNTLLILNSLKEIVEKHRPRTLSLSISLDGIGETHDKIRGVPGNYERALALIDALRKELPSVHVGVNFTIVPENYQDILNVYALSQERGVHFDCQFGHISECYYANADDAGRFKWDSAALEEVEQSIRVIADDFRKRERNLSDKMSVYFLEHMMRNQRKQKRKLVCYSGSISCFIDPYGDVFPCTMLPQAWGNAKGGFDTVWSSDTAKQSRAFIKAKRCACWTPCEAYNSLMNSPRIVLSNFWRELTGLHHNRS